MLFVPMPLHSPQLKLIIKVLLRFRLCVAKYDVCKEKPARPVPKQMRNNKRLPSKHG